MPMIRKVRCPQGQSRYSLIRAISALTVVMALASCGPVKPTPSVPGALSSRTTGGGRPSASESDAQSVDGYKRDVARCIYRANASLLFEGVPPPTLRAVVVLSIRIDSNGNAQQLYVVRSNGYKKLEEVALRSVRHAAPLPVPNRLIVRNGGVEFVETWLFRDDGRFQIRSLAEAQATLPR